jgi:SulP family sulfate permease
VLVTTLLATLFVELEFAIYVGVLLSLVFFLLRTSRPKIVTRVPDPKDPERRFVTDRTLPECPQLRMVRIDGSLFFGAVDHVQQTLQAMVEADPERKHILIIGDGINIIDIAGAEMLVQEAKRLRDMGGGLYIAKLKGTASDTMKRGGYMEKFGPENIFVRKADAVAAIFRRLDWDKCARCTRRIFEECRSVEPAPPDTAPVSRTAS